MWIRRAWDFTSSVVVSAGRVLYSLGQTYFGQKHAGQYFFGSGSHPATGTLAVLGMLGDLGIQASVKTPSIWRMIGPHRVPQPEEERPTSRKGKVIYQGLLACSTINGAFYLLLAYFGALTLSELIAELVDDDIPENDWNKAAMHLTALTVLFSAYRSYRYVNHFNFKQTVRKITHAIESGDDEFDKAALTKGLCISLLNTLAVPALTTFWVSSALTKIPYAYKLGAGQDALLAFAGISGLITSGVHTIPTAYSYFTTKHPVYHHSRLSHLVCYTAGFAGAIDSLNAGIFMLISMNEFSSAVGLNPYGSSLILSIPCALSAVLTYAICTVYSGHIDTLKDIYFVQSEEMLPLFKDHAAINYGTNSSVKEDICYSEIIHLPDKLEYSDTPNYFSGNVPLPTLFQKSKSYDDFCRRKVPVIAPRLYQSFSQ